MIQTINESQFIDAFKAMGRGDQFSYEALKLIYEYFEELDPDFDLDVIAICCDFEEAHYSDVIGRYDTDILDTDFNTEEEQIEFVRKYLEDNTSVVGESSYGTFVFTQF
jgi:hypothetical protein